MHKVLVTGVGAIIGYGVIRSLKQALPDIFIVGADIYADAIGQAWADQFEQAPLTSSELYLSWLEHVIKKHAIDLVIPGIEQDVHFYSDNRMFFEQSRVSVVLNSKPLIDITRDKWLIDQELVCIASPVRIPSYLTGSFDFFVQTLGLPFLLKPRVGYASKGIIHVDSEDVFDRHARFLGSHLIAQPIVGSDKEEYTVAVFGDGLGGICASITLRRELSNQGATAKAWVCDHSDLDVMVKQLCQHFKPLGPTNLQFRKDADCWKLLEINPRLSSATSLRTAFGYNEPYLALNYYMNNKEVKQPSLRNGFAMRYIEDYMVYDRNNF